MSALQITLGNWLVDWYVSPTQRQRAVSWFIVGAMLVLVHAFSRFNSPNPPHRRSTTTFGRYYLAAWAYALAWLLIYTISAGALGKEALAALQKGTVDVAADKLSLPLYAALGVTVFLTSFPWLKVADEWLRQIAHSAARIPSYADMVTEKLLLHQPATVDRELEQRIARDEPSTKELFSGRYSGDPVVGDWKRVAALLRALSEQPNWSVRYFEWLHRQEREALRKEHAATAADLLAALAATPGKAMPALAERIGQTRRSVCNYAARAVLFSTNSTRAYDGLVAALGFPAGPVRHAGTPARLWNRLALALVCISLILFIGLVVLGQFVPQPKRVAELPGFSKFMMIITLIASAIVLGLLPKRRPWARWHRTRGAWLEEDRPWLGYLTSSLATVLVTVGMIIVFYGAAGKPIGTALLLAKSSWGILTAVVAWTVAYLADDPPGYRTRRVEAALGAAALTGGMILTQLCLSIVPGETRHVMKVMLDVVVAAAIGMVLGFLTPEAYRRQQGRQGPPPMAGAGSGAGSGGHGPGGSGLAADPFGGAQHGLGPSLDPDK